MQEITLIGNLGRDAEIREHNGNTFAVFSVGCTTRRKNGDKVEEKTNWYDCSTESTKIAEFLRKGTKVFVRGNFKLDQYHSDALKKWVPIIRVYTQDIQLLSPKKDDNPAEAPTPTLVSEESQDPPF